MVMESAIPLFGSQGMVERYPCQLGNVPCYQLYFQERTRLSEMISWWSWRLACCKKALSEAVIGLGKYSAGQIVLQSRRL